MITTPAVRACFSSNQILCNTLESTITAVDSNTGTLDSQFMVQNGANLVVTPNYYSQIGTYEIQVTQISAIPGEDPIVWNAARITITCTITSLSIPSAPIISSYLIDSGVQSVTLTDTFLQVPACNYAINESISWSVSPTGPLLTKDALNDYAMTFETNNFNLAQTFTFSITNYAWYGTTSNSWTHTLSFDVEFIHPCRRSAITVPVLQTIPYQLRNGQEQITEVSLPTDAVSTQYGNGVNQCGSRVLSLIDLSTNVAPTWVSLDITSTTTLANHFKIRYATDDETTYAGQTWNFKIDVSLADYPVSVDALHPTGQLLFSISVQAANCDCLLI